MSLEQSLPMLKHFALQKVSACQNHLPIPPLAIECAIIVPTILKCRNLKPGPSITGNNAASVPSKKPAVVDVKW